MGILELPLNTAIDLLSNKKCAMSQRKIKASACKISGIMKSATTFFVVAFDMQKAKKSPARGGARNHISSLSK